jgi:hypothetical protein
MNMSNKLYAQNNNNNNYNSNYNNNYNNSYNYNNNNNMPSQKIRISNEIDKIWNSK